MVLCSIKNKKADTTSKDLCNGTALAPSSGASFLQTVPPALQNSAPCPCNRSEQTES